MLDYDVIAAFRRENKTRKSARLEYKCEGAYKAFAKMYTVACNTERRRIGKTGTPLPRVITYVPDKFEVGEVLGWKCAIGEADRSDIRNKNYNDAKCGLDFYLYVGDKIGLTGFILPSDTVYIMPYTPNFGLGGLKREGV